MSLSFSDKSRHLVTVVNFQSLSRVWPCNSMNHSTGFPVLHNLSELAKTHVHWVSDTIQPSHPLPYSSPSALNLSQHQGLFQWVNSSHQMAKVLELRLQHQSFWWIFRVDFLYDWLDGSPCCPRDSQDLLQHHNSKVSILLYGPILTSVHDYWKNHRFDHKTFVGKVMLSLLFNMLSWS